MLKYDFIFRCWSEMARWHFGADACGRGNGGNNAGMFNGRLKQRKGQKNRKHRREGGGLLRNARERLCKTFIIFDVNYQTP